MSQYETLLDQGFKELQQGDAPTAADFILQALRLDPERYEALYLLGLVALNLGRTLDARDLMLQGHMMAQDCREFSSALSFIYAGLGQLAETLYHSKMVHAQTPQHPILGLYEPKSLQDSNNALNRVSLPVFFENAMISWAQRNYALAQDFCEDALRFNHRDARALKLMGQITLARGDYPRAASVLRSLLATEDGGPVAMAALSRALVGLGNTTQAAYLATESLVRGEGLIEVLGDVAIVCKSLPSELAVSLQNKLQTSWSKYREKLAQEVEPALVYAEPLTEARPLKIGLMIGEDSVVNWAEQIDALLVHASSENMEIHVYAMFASNPEMVRRLTMRDYWTDITGMDDDTVAVIVAGEELDVLVDMVGITDDARPGVLAAHPATVVVSWLGGNTSDYGVDAVLTDTIVAPAFGEDVKTISMVMGSVLFQPRTSLMQATANNIVLPVSKNGYVTFGAKLDLAHIHASMHLWSRILMVVPNSRLLLGNIGPISSFIEEEVWDVAGCYGVADRIVFEPVGEVPIPHDFWRQCDIYLASILGENPAMVTEALALGVPTVIHNGDSLHHRLATSALAAAAQGHWCGTDQGYVSIAASMARNPKVAFDLRRGFTDLLPELPLFSSEFFAKIFARTLRQYIMANDGNS